VTATIRVSGLGLLVAPALIHNFLDAPIEVWPPEDHSKTNSRRMGNREKVKTDPVDQQILGKCSNLIEVRKRSADAMML
jgi:hypothetical protein